MQQIREKRRVAAASVAAALALTAAKLVIGIVTASLGVLAEAAHSGLDLAAALVTFAAVRFSDRPADASHLYGHGKAENLSALVEALLLVGACVWIGVEAVRRLFFAAVPVDPSLWAFLVLGASVVVDFSRSRALGRVAKKHHSQALEADALHFRMDIWSSLVVILGLGLVRYGRLGGADAAAALAVAALATTAALRLGRRAVDALLDRAPEGLAERLSRSVGGVAGIRRVLRTRVRDAGGQVFVDMTVDVPRHLSLEESHRVTEEAREAIRGISPGADVLVQSVPDAAGEGLLETIRTVAVREHASVHNVTVHWTERGVWIDLDVEVDPDLGFERAHDSATVLENRLRESLFAFRVAGVNAHIEPRLEEPAVGVPLGGEDAERYAERIRRIAGDCHDIELHRVGGKVYASFHLLVRADVPMAEVHSIAEEMENRLRREFPELGRVVIHTEPRPAG